eukprot:GHVR01113950.1.p1 GENE.GHVR01113950.1~~GHVR01113950.1.p1  ORF type:complete len:148 (+),score=6.66 GHVR01113950.1:1117-1560(+)
MITFIVIFSTSFIQVLTRVNISSNMNNEDNPLSEEIISGIHLAVGIDDINLTDGSARYFTLILEQVFIPTAGSPVKTQIHLTPCNVTDWKDLGNHFEHQFEAFKMNSMLCIDSADTAEMTGYEGSDHYKYLSFKVEQCTNNSIEHHC